MLTENHNEYLNKKVLESLSKRLLERGFDVILVDSPVVMSEITSKPVSMRSCQLDVIDISVDEEYNLLISQTPTLDSIVEKVTESLLSAFETITERTIYLYSSKYSITTDCKLHVIIRMATEEPYSTLVLDESYYATHPAAQQFIDDDLSGEYVYEKVGSIEPEGGDYCALVNHTKCDAPDFEPYRNPHTLRLVESLLDQFVDKYKTSSVSGFEIRTTETEIMLYAKVKKV